MVAAPPHFRSVWQAEALANAPTGTEGAIPCARQRQPQQPLRPRTSEYRFLLSSSQAFTLIELLVSVAVLAILVTLTSEIITQTSRATRVSSQNLDAASDARIVLERFGRDLDLAMLDGNATLLFASDGGDSMVGFLSQARARLTDKTSIASNLRGTVVAYKLRDFTVPRAGTMRLLGRGDGRLTFWEEDAAENASPDTGQLFSVSGLPDALTLSAGSDEVIMEWTTAGAGIVRFHISFLLDNGQIVQTPPRYRDFGRPQGGSSLDTGTSVPLALAPGNSADPNKRFVKALVVSLAVLDESTRLKATESGVLSEVDSKLGSPSDGETAMNLWGQKLGDLSAPLRQSIHFFERTYFIN